VTPLLKRGFINSLKIIMTLFIKSLLTSLYQREVKHPSLVKRGWGRFSDACQFNFETLNIRGTLKHKTVHFWGKGFNK